MFKASLNTVYAVKTITNKEEGLNRLSLQKGKDESFSDLFERLLNNQISGILALKELRGSIEFKEVNL
jgi:predicted CopG family antitoxin